MDSKTGKKKGRSFSLTDAELDRIERRTEAHGFADRNEYLLALLEADDYMELEPVLDAANKRVLRPGISSPRTDRERSLLESVKAFGKLLESMREDRMRNESAVVTLTPSPTGDQIKAGASTADRAPTRGGNAQEKAKA